MPLLLLPVAVVAAVLFALLLAPIAVVQRYRAGKSRQRARRWLTTINLVGVTLSLSMLLAGAAVTSAWVPGVLRDASVGAVVGAATGWLGLRTTRWERGSGALFYTPNRWLVLALTLLVAGRLIFGVWRSWATWRDGLSGEGWLQQVGLGGSLAAGALILSYYVVFWFGVRWRTRHSSFLGAAFRT